MIEVAVAPAELVVGTTATIEVVAYEHDLTVSDPGTVQLRLTRDDGTVLYDAPMSGAGAAQRTVNIPASSLTQVDRLTARATAADFVHEWVIPVVGSALFGIAAARLFDQGQLADPVRYPESFLIALRARIREAFTSVTGRRFVRELVTATVDTLEPDRAWLPDVDIVELRRLEAWRDGNWEAIDVARVLVHENGEIWARGTTFPVGPRALRATYVAGLATPPNEIVRAALRLAVSYMGALSSNLPDRALSFSDELGTFRLATPGVGGSWFGLPEVDAVLQRYRVTIPGVA